MRAFIAIHFKEEILDRIAAMLADLPTVKGVKMTPRANLHVTLKFLGDIDNEQEQHVVATLRALAIGQSPLPLTVSGGGVFPPTGRARTLWIGLAPSSPLQTLAAAVRREIPYGDNKPFVPHLTVGRIKRFDESQPLFIERFLAASDRLLLPDTIDNMSLMASDLSSGTPRYTTRANIYFGTHLG